MNNPVPIRMVRENLDHIPAHPLPDGYTLRYYAPGDDTTWTHIQAAADDINDVNLPWFRKEFGDDDNTIAERMLFLCDASGQAIGTSTAWFVDEWKNKPWGLIHWVAILPEFQGRGLAKPLLSATCQRLQHLGHTRAYLNSESTRLPAINLYLNFDFKPWIDTEQDEKVWTGIRESK